jgi:hypothetical protein
MTKDEYEDLNTMYMDMYIENFMNNENLTKDKLDIHLVRNTNNILIFKNFIESFGNSFDILTLINSMKIKQKNNDIDNIEEKQIFESQFNDPTESDDYIDTMTEIIDTYNKSQVVDRHKLEKLIEDKPHLANDEILSQITNE